MVPLSIYGWVILLLLIPLVHLYTAMKLSGFLDGKLLRQGVVCPQRGAVKYNRS